MNRNHRRLATRARSSIGASALLLTAATSLLALGTTVPAAGMPQAGEGGDQAGGYRHCEQGICLRYAAIRQAKWLADTDGDGFPDADERAAGTDPYDAASHPAVLDLLALAAHQELPSFREQFAQIVVLPETAPDGTALGARTSLAALTEALGALAPSRKDGLERLGISADLLGKFGISGSDLTTITAGLPTSDGSPTFDVRVSGTSMGLIAAGEVTSGTSLGVHPDGEGGRTEQISWFVTDEDGTTSYQVSIEYDGGGAQTGSGIVKTHTAKDGTSTTEECHSELGQLIECGGQLGTDISTGYKKGEQAKKEQPAPGASPGASQPGASPAPQPSGSAQPSSTTPAEPSTSPSASSDGGTYVTPEADTTVVLTAGLIRDTIRLVTGRNTTPVPADEPRPEPDPTQIEDPTDPYAYWEGPRGGLAVTTVSPIRLKDPYTNTGDPNGPLGGDRPGPTGAPS